MQQDPISLGIIQNTETIVRAAFDPSSGNAKTGNIKAAIIPKNDLLTGNFSVWRIEPLGIPCDELFGRLDIREGQSLFALCGVPAGVLRSMRFGEHRALSVVDECECDQLGNKHPAHAHIALCKNLLAEGVGKDHPEFEQLRTELHSLFKRGELCRRVPAND